MDEMNVILNEDAVDLERFMGIVNREVTQPISNVQAQTAWDRKNMLAIAEIRLHITQSQQVHMEFEFAADIWDRLQEIHQSGSFGDHFDLNRRLWTTKYDPDTESGTLQSHINGMMDIAQ